jgi:hypothetical protein
MQASNVEDAFGTFSLQGFLRWGLAYILASPRSGYSNDTAIYVK